MFALGSLCVAVVALAACGSRHGAAIETTLSAPLSELSGLARYGDVLYAVGDELPEVLAIPLDDGRPALDRARTFALTLAAMPHGSQLEGIAFDDAGLCWVLQEDPAVITVFDLEKGLVRRTFQLEFPADHPLAEAWRAAPNARGEGLFLLPNGHVLVAKQKAPAALVEFAPAGEAPGGARLGRRELPTAGPDALVATAYWLLDQKSVSDLAPGDGASLWALSGHEQTLCHIAELPPAPAGQPGHASCDAVYPIPEGLHGKVWEGLTFLDGDGRPGGSQAVRALLAIDAKSMRKDNLAIVKTAPR